VCNDKFELSLDGDIAGDDLARLTALSGVGDLGGDCWVNGCDSLWDGTVIIWKIMNHEAGILADWAVDRGLA
jgi:hypothetical protein